MFKKKQPGVLVALATGLSILPTAVMAHDKDDEKSYVLQGNCTELPASRTTEFHGNPMTSRLSLAMAGNQWVVFDHFMQAFNEHRDATSRKDIDLIAIGNQPRTLAGLQKRGADYFVELIPPGLERNQIKSGCMLLGNEDPRNYLPTSIQVDFDIFASTNINLMRDLAKSGFVTEAVP